jgi:hypothetical protein
MHSQQSARRKNLGLSQKYSLLVAQTAPSLDKRRSWTVEFPVGPVYENPPSQDLAKRAPILLESAHVILRIMWKVRRVWFFAVVLAASLAFGQEKPQTANFQLQGAFTPARAMNAIYGSYDYLEGVQRWKPMRTKSYPAFWPNTVAVTVLLDASYIESGVPKHLLVTSAIPKGGDPSEFTCHNCGALIGLILFAKNRGGWRVEASDLQFGQYGQFGQPPALSVQQLGPEHFGLIIPEGFGAQGAVYNSVTIILPKEGKFLAAFKVDIASSWSDQFCSGEVPSQEANCVAFDGSVDLAPTPRSEYYDIILTKRIYRTLSEQNPERTTAVRYRFNGSKYAARPNGR